MRVFCHGLIIVLFQGLNETFITVRTFISTTIQQNPALATVSTGSISPVVIVEILNKLSTRLENVHTAYLQLRYSVKNSKLPEQYQRMEYGPSFFK